MRISVSIAAKNWIYGGGKWSMGKVYVKVGFC
jgi:hypothetical protein